MSADQGSSKVLTPTSEAAPRELDALDVLDGIEGVTALDAVPSPADPAAAAAPALPAAERETRQTALLVAGALALGGLLQIFIAPGPWALVIGAGVAGLFVLVLSQVMPGRWRETMSGFRFTATLLFVLAGAAILGTLILQNRPMAFYESRYGQWARSSWPSGSTTSSTASGSRASSPCSSPGS